METEIEVSVIVLTYFHEQYIENAIKSVLSQNTDFSYEIIVSDDASEDSTIDITERIKEQYPNIIRIIRHDNNIGTTRNLYEAFLESKGKYITLLAGDDYYCNDNKLTIQREYLEKNPDCFAVAVTIEGVYTDGQLTGESSPPNEYRGVNFDQKDFARGINYPIHGIMFRNQFEDECFRRTFHLSVEFSRLIEDLSLCLFMFDFGKVHVLPDVCYRFTTRRLSDENQYNFNSQYKGIKSLIMHIELMKKLQKYYGKKIDLSNRMAEPSWAILKYSIRRGKPKLIKHLKGVPIRCLMKGGHMWVAEIMGRN